MSKGTLARTFLTAIATALGTAALAGTSLAIPVAAASPTPSRPSMDRQRSPPDSCRRGSLRHRDRDLTERFSRRRPSRRLPGLRSVRGRCSGSGSGRCPVKAASSSTPPLLSARGRGRRAGPAEAVTSQGHGRRFWNRRLGAEPGDRSPPSRQRWSTCLRLDAFETAATLSAGILPGEHRRHLHAITPGRVLDSRIGLGATRSVLKVKQSFAVGGLFGVPADAVGVTGNVTIVGQTQPGYVTVARVWPPTHCLPHRRSTSWSATSG